VPISQRIFFNCIIIKWVEVGTASWEASGVNIRAIDSAVRSESVEARPGEGVALFSNLKCTRRARTQSLGKRCGTQLNMRIPIIKGILVI